MEEQVADAELDEAVETPDDAEDDRDDRKVVLEAAPQCAGCHRRGIELTLLENGKRYCVRCAQEVERLMGIGPLFPGAENLTIDHSAHSSDEVEDEEPSETEATAADSTPMAADVASSPEPEAEPSAETDDTEDAADAEAAPARTADVTSEVEPIVAEAASDPDPDPDPESSVSEPAVEEPVAATSHEPADDLEADGAAAFDLTKRVADANHEAAAASNSLMPRPAAPITKTATSTTTPEETPLMERVEEQTRPVRLEATATTAAPPPSDLLGALSAERARLLDQRELLEVRFRAETEAIDERLVHVESLLGDQRESLAS